MDKELHEKALDAAVNAVFDHALLNKRGQIKIAIAIYLKTAGLKVVPVEPTGEMWEAGENSGIHTYNGTYVITPDNCYSAMLAAFPSPFDEVE